MGEGLLVRRSQKTNVTAAPSTNIVASSDNYLFTFTNNDTEQVDVFYGIDTSPTTKVTVDASSTSDEIVVFGLTPNASNTIFAYAIVTNPKSKKIKSPIVSTTVTTDAPVYIAATGGTTLEYDDGGKRYKSHTFTSNGTFEVTAVGNGERSLIDYLIIAAGGGGSNNEGGGGGAGGYRTTFGDQGGLGTLDDKVTVTAQTYGIVVGAGGNGGAGANGLNGSTSVFSNIFSIGGGGGGQKATFPLGFGSPGGSGGGGSGRVTAGTTTLGGVGIANQGFRGGNTTNNKPAGGGGAGEQGLNNSSFIGATRGGNGLDNILRTGSAETRAGGGGGGSNRSEAGQAPGGTGGGGIGGNRENPPGSGQVNTGGGGGAHAAGGSGGNGGSGIVIIRYEIAPV